MMKNYVKPTITLTPAYEDIIKTSGGFIEKNLKGSIGGVLTENYGSQDFSIFE